MSLIYWTSTVSWRESANRVCLGGAAADFPSPRDGSEHPVFAIGLGGLSHHVSTVGDFCRGQRSLYRDAAGAYHRAGEDFLARLKDQTYPVGKRGG